jgi:peptide/nickel transport system ATP-binding protein
MKNILEIRDLIVGIDSIPPTWILREANLSIGEGQIVGLVGESGAGKTMVSRVILGFTPEGSRVFGGEIHFCGSKISDLNRDSRPFLLGKEVTYIPQNPMTALNPVQRINDQMTDVLIRYLQLKSRDATKRAVSLLSEVQIHDPEKVLKLYPHQLSGGMRQRVLIAIAFACNPSLVIADEPTTALDVTVQKEILGLIKRMQSSHGTSMLFVSHDLGVVSKICDVVNVMYGGQVLETQEADALFSAPSHVYTKALLSATPRYDRPGDLLEPVSDRLVTEMGKTILSWDKRAEACFYK